MGLAKRIIPCLDVTAGRVVKGINFVGLRDAGDPVEIARRYDEQGADELTFLDITASSDGRDLIVRIIEAVAAQVFIPLTVGGGVRSVEDVRRLLNAGADKVSINTAAVQNPQLVNGRDRRYGSQCIVVAVDAKRVPGSGAAALGGVHPRRAQPDRARCAGMGPQDGSRGRRRDPAHQHGPRRHPQRLRSRADARVLRRALDPGDRQRRRGQPRPPGRRHPRKAAPTRCSPRASFTTASTPCARPRSTWPSGASRYGCEALGGRGVRRKIKATRCSAASLLTPHASRDLQ